MLLDQSKKSISIALYGNICNINEKFSLFYREINNIFNIVNKPYTHIGIKSTNFIDGKIKTRKRFEKKLFNEIESGNTISSLEFYFLPEDYQIAGFDNLLSIQVTSNFLLATFETEDFFKIKDLFLSKFCNIFIFNNYEIFEMSRNETPWLYVLHVNPETFYKTLNVIERVDL